MSRIIVIFVLNGKKIYYAKKGDLCETIEMVHTVLQYTETHNLTAEVIASTLNILKNSPEMDMQEVLKSALKEWDL